MAGRISLSAVSSALSDLPGPAKWVGVVLTVGPLMFALLGMGWAGWQTPGKLDVHIAQMADIRQETTARDSAMLREMHESNRLTLCNLKFRSYEERLRCAVSLSQ